MLVNNCAARSKVLNVVVILAALLLICHGCDSKKASTGSISGRIEQNGKPVFPVVLLLLDQNGKSITANVKNPNGEFSLFGLDLGSRYSVAIEPIQLEGISQADRAEAARRQEQAKAEGRELRREDTLPAQFQNANIDFPKKYTRFEESGLIIDCTNQIPAEPVVLNLN
jgi:hypothetical protein